MFNQYGTHVGPATGPSEKQDLALETSRDSYNTFEGNFITNTA